MATLELGTARILCDLIRLTRLYYGTEVEWSESYRGRFVGDSTRLTTVRFTPVKIISLHIYCIFMAFVAELQRAIKKTHICLQWGPTSENRKMTTMRTPRSTMRTTTKLSSVMCTLLLILLTTAGAAAQNVLAKIPIPATSATGQVIVNKVLNRVYVSAGFSPGGTLTVIDGKTLTVLTTLSNGSGVNVDIMNDNFWTGNVAGGQVLTYSGSTNTQISANTVGFCPGETAFDCSRRRFWVGAQCGAGNDPVFVFNADTFALIAGPIATGGTMGPIVVDPANGKLHVESGGISKEVNPSTFAVTPTSLGTVLAADEHKKKLFATSGNSLQIIDAATDSVNYTIPLGYTPGSQIAVNNALRHLYLLNPGGNKVDVRAITAVADATDVRGQEISTFSLGTGNTPQGIGTDAIRGRVYVVVNNSGSYSLWVIEDTTSVRACDYVKKGNGNGE